LPQEFDRLDKLRLLIDDHPQCALIVDSFGLLREARQAFVMFHEFPTFLRRQISNIIADLCQKPVIRAFMPTEYFAHSDIFDNKRFDHAKTSLHAQFLFFGRDSFF